MRHFNVSYICCAAHGPAFQTCTTLAPTLRLKLSTIYSFALEVLLEPQLLLMWSVMIRRAMSGMKRQT